MALLMAVKLATCLCAVYALAAETVAIFSVIEIGPNLLAAITSGIGAVVLVVQLRLARRLTQTDAHAEVAKVAAEEVGHLASHTAERVTKVERKVNGD